MSRFLQLELGPYFLHFMANRKKYGSYVGQQVIVAEEIGIEIASCQEGKSISNILLQYFIKFVLLSG